MAFSVPEQWAEIWEGIQAGIVIIDAESHEIIAANPEARRLTGFTDEEMIGHSCHGFICPSAKGRCPVSDLGLNVDRVEKVLLAKGGREIPVLKTISEMELGGRKLFIETFIDITPEREAERALIAYIREATLRIRNPVELVRDNIREIRDNLACGCTRPENAVTALSIQEKNLEGVLNNLQELDRAIAEKNTEILDALREYLKR